MGGGLVAQKNSLYGRLAAIGVIFGRDLVLSRDATTV